MLHTTAIFSAFLSGSVYLCIAKSNVEKEKTELTMEHVIPRYEDVLNLSLHKSGVTVNDLNICNSVRIDFKFIRCIFAIVFECSVIAVRCGKIKSTSILPYLAPIITF